MAVVNAINFRPKRPGVVRGTVLGRLGQQLEINQGFAAVTQRSTNTVCTSIAAANNDDIFVFGGNVVAVFEV